MRKYKIVRQEDVRKAIPFYYIYVKYKWFGRWHNIYGCSDYNRVKERYDELLYEQDCDNKQKKEPKKLIAKSY